MDDLKEVQSSEFVVVQSSLVLWLNQFSVWFCFRQCVRQSRQRRNSPLHHSGLTSTAWRTALLFSSISHRATWPNPFHTSVSNCLCSIVVLPVCSRQDWELDSGRWRSTSQSWHVQARHLLFCFEQLLQCFGSDWCHCLKLSYVFLFFCRLWAFRSDCYGFTIPSAWVWVSAFLATCSGLTVMEFRGHSDKFWLSWGSVCCSVGWGCRNPMRARMWARM